MKTTVNDKVMEFIMVDLVCECVPGEGGMPK